MGWPPCCCKCMCLWGGAVTHDDVAVVTHTMGAHMRLDTYDAVCCCSLLQSVAVCCSLLQSVAVCCSLLQSVAVCCSLLQSVNGGTHDAWHLWCKLQYVYILKTDMMSHLTHTVHTCTHPHNHVSTQEAMTGWPVDIVVDLGSSKW